MENEESRLIRSAGVITSASYVGIGGLVWPTPDPLSLTPNEDDAEVPDRPRPFLVRLRNVWRELELPWKKDEA